ncbi:hypothetical protein HMPREF0424_0962 [Gardnerella vaginalis 409-05]|nr:hypothetical protein HMPREF0424_0962 [Gardnerella vaginalis 409-05]
MIVCGFVYERDTAQGDEDTNDYACYCCGFAHCCVLSVMVVIARTRLMLAIVASAMLRIVSPLMLLPVLSAYRMMLAM